ncbi:hypothetical protein CCP3SC1_340011 [Gammaproteobacteria bacterium]
MRNEKAPLPEGEGEKSVRGSNLGYLFREANSIIP